VSDSEGSEVHLLRTPNGMDESGEISQPQSVLSHRFRESPSKPPNRGNQETVSTQEDTIAVMVSGPARPWEYQPFHGSTTVDSVLEELEGPGGKLFYKIEYEDGRREDVSVQLPIRCKPLLI
jgi:chromodomain-helicase-DNA-binding protein 4